MQIIRSIQNRIYELRGEGSYWIGMQEIKEKPGQHDGQLNEIYDTMETS